MNWWSMMDGVHCASLLEDKRTTGHLYPGTHGLEEANNNPNMLVYRKMEVGTESILLEKSNKYGNVIF